MVTNNIKRRKIFSKIRLIGFALLIVGLATIGVSFYLYSNSQKSSSSVTPTFTTISPNESSIDEKDGWSRVSPDSSEAVYAYADTIDGVAITVSQQKLPSSFLDNTNKKVSELAASYNANNTVTAGKTTLYIGTNTEGPQWVIFTKSQLLIMIKSDSVIKDDSWISYVKSLS